ncbi:hypothetical protein C8Q79DRAFT_913036, partial [Trametes meyenii]
ARELHLEIVRENHPEMTPRGDFDVLMLGSHDLDREWGIEEKSEWLSQMWEQSVRDYGSAEVVLQHARDLLDSVVEPTGRKPRPNDPDVDILTIPNDEHSIRLWPGSFTEALYCMDFIKKSTGQAVNVPKGFTLWLFPEPSAPWLQGSGPVQLISLERSFHIPPEKIHEGEEKFVLRDGMTCVLCRTGKRDVRFTVPRRERSQEAEYYDMDVLN